MASRPRLRRRCWGYVVRFGFDLLAGIGHGNGKSALAHDGQIHDVIAHVGDLVERHAFFLMISRTGAS